MEKISLLCPTRNRPFGIQRLLKSIIDTVDKKENVDIWFYIDDDDSATISAISQIENEFGKLDIHHKIGPRIKIRSIYWNKLYKASSGPILMVCSDDIAFRTQNWDTEIINEFDQVKDKILLVHGDDMTGTGTSPTLPFTSRVAADLLGYFFPPYFEAYVSDSWLELLYQKIGRIKYRPDIKIEHLWCRIGKSLYDKTYLEQYERIEASRRIWREKRKLIPKDSEKLREYITSLSR